MVEKTDVAAVLELIRPSLQADGGDVKLIDVDEDGVVTVCRALARAAPCPR